MSSTVITDEKISSTNNANHSDTESCSSIEVESIEIKDGSDSDAAEVIKKNKYVPTGGIKLAVRNVDQPSSSRSDAPHQNNDSRPNIGTITMQNSAHPMFGNKTFYKGQITINQFINEENRKNEWKQTESQRHESAEYVCNSTKEPNQNDNGQLQNERLPEENDKHPMKRNKKVLLCVLVVAALFVGLTLVLVFFVGFDKTNKDKENDNGDQTHNMTNPFVIFSREDWFAVPPTSDPINLQLPSIRVIITDTESESCSNNLECKEVVRDIQYQYMNWVQYSDIPHNFLVGGDGAVYVGRGWDIEGEHTPGCNKRSICIAFIGTFEEKTPPKRQLQTAQKLIEEGVKQHKIKVNYDLYGQYQLKDTEDPLKKLYEIIRKWDHWTPTNQNSTDVCSTEKAET